jgi:hypothetical protein
LESVCGAIKERGSPRKCPNNLDQRAKARFLHLAFPPRTIDTYLALQFEHEVVDTLMKKAIPGWQVILELNRMSIPEPKVEHHTMLSRVICW